MSLFVAGSTRRQSSSAQSRPGLVQYLEDKQLIRTGPFDGSPRLKADQKDLDDEKIVKFFSLARRARGLPLSEDASPKEVLTHLNLLDGEKPTNAAVLLFAKQP